MRIGGIASGFDTEQMVKDLMRAESMKMDKFFRQEETLKWQREALNTTNKTLADFILKARSGFGLTSTSSTGSIQNHGSQSFDWVKKASSSDESIIKATASATAMEGNYSINVKSLAAVASVTSENIKNVQVQNEEGQVVSLIDGKGTFTVSRDFNITVGKDAEVVNIKIKKGETMADIVKQMNDAVGEDGKSLGLRAAYDSNLGKLMINTKEQGEDQLIQIQSTVLTKKIFGSTNDALGDGVTGEDAEIYFNGDTIK